ncbi:MAG: hypothetical protein AAF805_04030 [Planctomycetota bacterium]
MTQIAMTPAGADRFGPPSTTRLAGRFFWKECRRSAVSVVGVSVLAAALMALLTWFGPAYYANDVATTIAIGGSVMIAVATAVTAFSVEKEEGTATLLMQLPRDRLAVMLGKVAGVIAVVALGTLLLVGTATLVAGRWPANPVFVTVGGLFVLEALAWGLVASLACPQPLVAAVLAIAAASASGQLAMAFSPNVSAGYTQDDYAQAGTMRLVLVLAGALVAGGLSARWPGPPLGQGRRQPSQRVGAIPLAVAVGATPSPRSLAALHRLLWQSARQCWGPAVAAAAIGAFFAVSWAFVMGPMWGGGSVWWVATAALAPAALVGTNAFRGDQVRGGRRFLAEHAGTPRRLWLARHAALLGPLLLVLATVAWLASGPLRQAWVESLDPYPVRPFDTRVVETATLTALRMVDDESARLAAYTVAVGFWSLLTAYAWGQLASLTLRSGVFAAMASLVAAVALGGWTTLVAAWRLPPLVCLAPLFVGPMVATLLRVDAWMFDRRGVGWWLAPAAAVVASAVAAGWWVPAIRLGQIDGCERLPIVTSHSYQWVDAAIDDARESLRDGAEVLDGYTRLAGGDPPEAELWDESIERLVALSNTPCRLPMSPIDLRTRLAWLGVDAPADVDLDAELRRRLALRRMVTQECNGAPAWGAGYAAFANSDAWLRWATAEGQTPERIREAIAGLAKIDRGLLRPHQRVLNDAVNAIAVINGGDVLTGVLPEWAAPAAARFRWLDGVAPWERERAERAVAVRAGLVANWLAVAEDGVLAPRESDEATVAVRRRLRTSARWEVTADFAAAIDPLLRRDTVSSTVFNETQATGQGPSPDGWMRLAMAAETSYVGAVHQVHCHSLESLLQGWVDRLARGRAERLRLALVAYRLENGSYPETLDAILEDPKWWDGMHRRDGVDPYAGEPFGYNPEGFPRAVVEVGYNTVNRVSVAGAPVLWCTGSGDASPADGRVEEVTDDRDDLIVRRVVHCWPGEERDGERVTYLQRRGQNGWGTGEFWLPLPREFPAAIEVSATSEAPATSDAE